MPALQDPVPASAFNPPLKGSEKPTSTTRRLRPLIRRRKEKSPVKQRRSTVK
jgi:hypothetical protein